ncbi:uncharacterized protein E5676_scaffold124G00040 [Cucumis melo var. makuwa]|uniref:Uncharacterized protein n=1 Tax=Cucumis melo var. makuwa TaxID=1194695 RepID=A0A5D3DSI6_CUCMM|nr:uncharacterized protein E6C27_scaffold67G006360 [Cucumis melo var. makuwa]TYK26721.1 uncharacterized protein E5676_scaffold124G00040 [Cucumis melo var. makuwa]
MNDFETVALTQAICDVFKNGVVEKMTYPGSFIVPCSIGGMDLGCARCNLEANINLIFLSIFKKLGIGEVQPTQMAFQITDKSITRPKGKIEEVLVKVDKFLFHAYFVILDFKADREVPIILGWPFLSIGRALINVHQGGIDYAA